MSGYYLLKNGEFAYNKSYSVGYDFGSIKRLDRYSMGALSTLYICFALTKHNSDFIKTYFDSLKWYKDIYLIAAEGARNHGLLNVPTEDFFSTKHFIPQSEKEQKKIAEFLVLLDKRIQKQEQLVESLKLYKRGVLSQIFNQSLSFDGSATRWQKKTIGDIFAERCERANGDEELLAVTINTGIQKRDDIDKKDNSSENKSNYKKVYPGDIAYNTMRMWQGASGYSSFDGIVSPAYTVIYPIEPNKQNIVFWAYYFKDLDLIKKFQKYSQGLTSDTWNLKFAQLADIHIYEPPYETQCNIANFLTKFDNKITIAEHYCNKLHSIKHGLLNSMFI